MNAATGPLTDRVVACVREATGAVICDTHEKALAWGPLVGFVCLAAGFLLAVYLLVGACRRFENAKMQERQGT